MTDKTAHIGEIVQVMLNTWDMPPDCNEGELFTYAETLYDRIGAGTARKTFTPTSPRCRSSTSKWRSPMRSGGLSTAPSNSQRAGPERLHCLS